MLTLWLAIWQIGAPPITPERGAFPGESRTGGTLAGANGGGLVASIRGGTIQGENGGALVGGRNGGTLTGG